MPVKKKRVPASAPVQDNEPVLEEDDDVARIIARYKEKITSPLSGIRSHCVECMGAAVRDIATCADTDCSLYPFRMGVNQLDPRAGKSKPFRST